MILNTNVCILVVFEETCFLWSCCHPNCHIWCWAPLDSQRLGVSLRKLLCLRKKKECMEQCWPICIEQFHGTLETYLVLIFVLFPTFSGASGVRASYAVTQSKPRTKHLRIWHGAQATSPFWTNDSIRKFWDEPREKKHEELLRYWNNSWTLLGHCN